MYIFIIIDKFILIMNVKLKVLTIFISALLLISCSKNKPESELHTKDSKEKKTKEETPDNDSASNLSKYDLSSDNPKILTLPSELKEISGMTMTPDGRLYAEQDESGIIYQVDPGNGEIVKKFYLGKPPVKKDFEDIAYANDKFYLLHSKARFMNAVRAVMVKQWNLKFTKPSSTEKMILKECAMIKKPIHYCWPAKVIPGSRMMKMIKLFIHSP